MQEVKTINPNINYVEAKQVNQSNSQFNNGQNIVTQNQNLQLGGNSNNLEVKPEIMQAPTKPAKKGFLSGLTNMSFIKKIKKIKHIEVIVLLIAAVIVGLIFFSTLTGSKSNSDSSNNTSSQTADDYATTTQNNLKNILSAISGAGSVSVLVTLSDNGRIEYEMTTETKDGVTITTPALDKDGKPIIKAEYPPTINSVFIVASGASDTGIKLKLTQEAQSILPFDSKISVIY
jgi:hypothetical protein